MKELLFFLMLFPAFLSAQTEWEYVSTDSENAKFYIKDINKKKYSTKITVWVKIVDADKIVKSKKGNINKKGSISMQQWIIECEDKTIEVSSITKYNSEGKVILSDRGSYVPQPVVPDSIGEAVVLQACAYQN